MVKRGLDVWDVILILVGLVILFWAILKSFGVIQSPTWVEMVPFISLGVGVIGAVFKLGKMMRGIEETEAKVNRLVGMEERFSKVENEHNLCMSGKLKVKH